MADSSSSGTLDVSDVKILVSCHKPSVIPDSDMFLPVHVGARFADKALPGAVSDNDGDNISSRNFSFSEMSGQYWAWKNLGADKAPYVGQCHYRRFFCFDGKPHRANDHAQIELPLLDEAAIAEYRLADEALILDAIARVDAIVPPRWSVVGVPTPHGPQNTIRSHMEAYELVDHASFDLFLDVVEQRQPDYAPYVRRYLDGSEYIGYNCFILRRDLFDELCAYEFDVLLAFDKLFDYNNRTPTQMRICGYLGEVLFSAYVNKLRDEGAMRVREVPLTFFFETAHGASAPDLFQAGSSVSGRSLVRRGLAKAGRMLGSALRGKTGEAYPAEAAPVPSESAEAASVLVTVIVPVHNLQNYVIPCLESIRLQTHGRLQVIVVDDGSTDDTRALVEEFARADDRFSVMAQEKSNAGVARNRGMERAQGEYLLFFDGDDLMDPAMVQLLLERALETDADVTVCRARSFCENPTEPTDENFGPFGVDLARVHTADDMRGRVFSSCVGWPWDKLFRTDFVQKNILSFQSLSSTNDAAFVFESLVLAERVAFVSEALAFHRRRPGSIEGSRHASPHNAYAAFLAICDRLSQLPGWSEGLEIECVNWALGHLRWNYRTLSGEARNEAFGDYLQVLELAQDWDRAMFGHREDWWVRDTLGRADRPAQELLADQVIDMTYGVEDLAKLHRRVGELEAQVEGIRRSVSFRMGRAITAPLRKLRDRVQ